MSSTRDRLERLFSTPGRKVATTSAESLKRLESELLGTEAESLANLSLKERLEKLVAVTKARPRRAPEALVPERRAISLEDALAGEEVTNDRGTFYTVERLFPLEHHHGRIALKRLRDVSARSFSVLARGSDEDEIDLERALFIDTETTGLAGGSGTCAFLVGLGFVEDDAFVVRQLLMRSHGEEPAMLEALRRHIEERDLLVSYNGKSFDIPLLESRFILSRLRYSFEEKLHFDLLHPARSLWRERFESCRLGELESLLLGLEREMDVPGHLIPDIYFRYIRTGDASRLPYVLEHNRYDILSLAALTISASDMLDEDTVPEDPRDDFSLGRLFERAAQPERSMHHYRRAVDSGLTGAPRRRSLKSLAEAYKRRGAWEEARRLWEELLAEGGIESVAAIHELAMMREHRDRDFEEALSLTEIALARLEESYEWPLSFRTRWTDAFRHRRRRLRRRLDGAHRLSGPAGTRTLLEPGDL